MRDFVRAIRAALRAMKTWVWRVVDGVLTLVQTDPVGAGPAPDGDHMDIAQPEHGSEISRFERIRRLAVELVRNPDAPSGELMRGIAPLTATWLAAMSDEMLLKVGTASDEALAQHMVGKQPIRGVLAYDTASVDDYRRAMSIQEAVDDYELDETMAPAI